MWTWKIGALVGGTANGKDRGSTRGPTAVSCDHPVPGGRGQTKEGMCADEKDAWGGGL